MNERIKELAEQSGASISTTFGEYAVVFGEREAFEKFAELIVGECATHLHRRGVEGFGILEERNLKEHFGVEE